MDAKVTREFELTNDVLTAEAQENIQEFIKIWASKFKIDWNKDITISIRSRHNEDGANLIIKIKDSDIEDIDPNQLNLFKPPETEETKLSKSRVEKEPAY